MSESDGLHKLTAYLNQTRRQAEAAIDALNVRIFELQAQNEQLVQQYDMLEKEKEQFKALSEQLKQVGTTKQRLQERDDWKSLIDSVQKDRARLQDECCNLESELEIAKCEILELRVELERRLSEREETTDEVLDSNSASTSSPAGAIPSPGSSPQRKHAIKCDFEDDFTSPVVSPLLDKNGQEMDFNFSVAPKIVVRQLKAEIKKLVTQVGKT